MIKKKPINNLHSYHSKIMQTKG